MSSDYGLKASQGTLLSEPHVSAVLQPISISIQGSRMPALLPLGAGGEDI